MNRYVSILLVLFWAAGPAAGFVAQDEESGEGGPYLAGVDGVSNPQLEKKVSPIYPDAARKKGIEAKVALQVVIDKQGDVTDSKVLSCSADSKWKFEQAAITAVAQWKYLPATRKNKPVDVLFNVMVNFTIQN